MTRDIILRGVLKNQRGQNNRSGEVDKSEVRGKEDYADFDVDNLPIRGYSTKLPNIELNVMWDYDEANSIKTYIDEPVDIPLHVEFTGDKGALPDPSAKVEWKLGAESEGLTITPDKDDDSEAILTAAKCADTELFVTVGGLSKVSALLRARRLAGGTPARKGVSRTTDSESWAGNGNGVS